MAADVDDYDWDEVGDGMADIMKEFYPQLFKLAYAEAGAVLPTEISFDLKNKKVAEVIDQLAGNIKDVSDTVKANVQRIVGDGLDKGDSGAAIAKALREYGVTDSVSRSEMIARTETTTGYSQGSLLAYQEAGVQKKQWMASEGSCPECTDLDGETVAMDDEFSAGVDCPPLHPDCTCAVGPVVGDE